MRRLGFASGLGLELGLAFGSGFELDSGCSSVPTLKSRLKQRITAIRRFSLHAGGWTSLTIHRRSGSHLSELESAFCALRRPLSALLGCWASSTEAGTRGTRTPKRESCEMSLWRACLFLLNGSFSLACLFLNQFSSTFCCQVKLWGELVR